MAENKELVDRYQGLLDKLGTLRKLNKDLEDRLRLAEQKLGSLEQKAGVSIEQADDVLRKARATMARLMEETERRVSQ